MERIGRLFTPMRPAIKALMKPQNTQCHRVPMPSSSTSPFSTSASLQKRSKGPKKDPRITAIRYHLNHPLTPRPLRFSRLRYLRHWTIDRAWKLYRAKQREAHSLELERQYNSMREACEALRVIGRDGVPGGPDEGRLYRRALEKKGIWKDENGVVGVPIEYGRIQTEWPSRQGWDHDWKRA